MHKLGVALLVCLLTTAGCSSADKAATPANDGDPSSSADTGQQAQADPQAAPRRVIEDDGLVTEYGSGPVAAPADQSPVLGALNSDGAIAIDAMVGQVNGRAIYANKVFEPLHEQLTTRGKELPRQRFRVEVQGIIAKRLESMIIQALILGEAERNLTQREQYGLSEYLKQKRKELINLIGTGSAVVADSRIRNESGITLDERVEEIRKQTLVQSYVKEKIEPQINVSRKDIKRYYKNHYEEFNPPPGRTIHMIRAKDAAAAAQIEMQLAEGKPFLEVAANAKLNRNKPDEQGFFMTTKSKKFFNDANINEQVLQLKQGEHTPKFKLGSADTWVLVKSLSTGEARPLRDVQGRIEKKLRDMQYTQLTNRFYAELFETGSYDSPEVMVNRLVEVAMNRYALPR